MAERELNAVVTQRIEVTPDLVKLRIVPDGWELPDFKPGQYLTVGLPGTAPRSERADVEENPPADPNKLIMRAYSVASSSVAREFLELYVGLVRTGALSPRLLALRPGDKLWISQKCKGMFTLAEVPEEFDAVLIATGTGVAPYMSMIRTELASGLKRRFAVFHGAYHSTDLGYHSELTTLSSISDKFLYVPTLSHPHEERTPWHGHVGFVQSVWENGVLEKAWGHRPSPADTHVFLCGNPFMIRDMLELLASQGFVQHSKKTPGQVHAEQFFVKT